MTFADFFTFNSKRTGTEREKRASFGREDRATRVVSFIVSFPSAFNNCLLPCLLPARGGSNALGPGCCDYRDSPRIPAVPVYLWPLAHRWPRSYCAYCCLICAVRCSVRSLVWAGALAARPLS